MENGEKSRILVIGATGHIGKFIVDASIKEGHPTYALVRETTLSSTDPVKEELVQRFKNSGVTLLKGELSDHLSLVEAIKQVDVVISAIGSFELHNQDLIITAIKESGNIKRFFPSEFDGDVDHTTAVEPAKSAYAVKSNIRRLLEADGSIPFTCVSSNCFAGMWVSSFAQPDKMGPPPPKEKVIIMGEGNAKAVYNSEVDIATYTIKAVDDPRTMNKVLHIRDDVNTFSFNELVTLWESKSGGTLEKVFVPEEQILEEIRESPFPVNLILSIKHSVLVKGDQTNFKIDLSKGVVASELYPDVKFTTVDEYLNNFV